MSVAMGAEGFSKLLVVLRKEIQLVDEIENWTFIHLLSYLAYESEISVGLLERGIIPLLEKQLPKMVIEEWKNDIKQQIEERKPSMFEKKDTNTKENLQEQMKIRIMEGNG